MYPYTIHSVSDMHPVLVNHPNITMPAFGGVNESNAIGTPVDVLAVTNAESTVELLSGAKSKCTVLLCFHSS